MSTKPGTRVSSLRHTDINGQFRHGTVQRTTCGFLMVEWDGSTSTSAEGPDKTRVIPGIGKVREGIN